MATNHVHAGHRIKAAFAVAHTAGDLVYHNGFFGVVQDSYTAADATAGKLATLILGDVWMLSRTPTTVAMGTVLSAPATAIATSLPLGAAGATVGYLATAGWFPVGRVTATGGATTAKVQIFNPNPVY